MVDLLLKIGTMLSKYSMCDNIVTFDGGVKGYGDYYAAVTACVEVDRPVTLWLEMFRWTPI